MSLNLTISKAGMYLFAKEANQKNISHLLVGGLAVQAYAANQFSYLLRPTIDADILVPNVSFPQFKEGYGQHIARQLKNKFGLEYHVTRNHHANTVQIMQSTENHQKEIFLLNFTRYQPELYNRIEGELREDMETKGQKIKLSDMNITNEQLSSLKAKILDSQNYSINVVNEEELLLRKKKQVEKKQEGEVSNYFNDVRKRILSTGINTPIQDSVESMLTSILHTRNLDSNRYSVEKDIYDYVLLKKVFS